MIIGKGTNGNVNLDLTRLISTRLLIQANSGGGKSWLIRRLLEQSHGQVQQIVIDLEGEFSTLRDKYDYLLVGKGGEIPANIKTAELLAIKLLTLNVSTIIDLSELQKHERITFVKRFLDSLINAPRELWHSCLVVIDEAHQFCPEKAKSESANSVIDLLTRGRKRGFCGVLATQRIAKLNKDAAAECTNGFVGRTVMDIDRKRASYDLGFATKEQELSLKKMADGEFFGYGPAISKEDYVKLQVGGVNTTHPEPGKNIIKASKTPDNIKKLLKDVIDLPKEVEVELKTTNDFKTKILELKRELTLTKKGSIPQQVKEDSRAIERAREQGFKEATNNFRGEISQRDVIIKNLGKNMNNILNIANQGIPELGEVKYSFKPKTIIKDEPSKVNYTKKSIEKVSDDIDNVIDLGPCPKKIYSFLYNHPERSFSRSHVGAFTGYSKKSGGFSNAIARLNSMGLIQKNGDTLQIKEMDSNLAEEYDFSKEAIINNLGPCPTKIYQMLLDNPYEEISREEIAEQTGYSVSSGGFSNAVAKLNSLGLIEKNGSYIKLNQELLE